MIKASVLLAACFTLAAAPAVAQTFPPTTTPPPTQAKCLGCIAPTPTPIQPTDLIFLYRPLPSPGSPGATSLQDYGALPISAFAGSADIAAVRAEMSEGLSQLDDRLSSGVALAAALDLQQPAAGAANRVGGALSTYRGQTAAGFGYTRQSGAMDFGVAVGAAKSATMGKASLGFSW